MPPRRTQPLSSFLANAKQLNIELRKLVMDPSELPAYFKTLGKQLATMAIVKLIHRAANGTYDVKVKTFGSNTTTMCNEKTATRDWADGVKLVSIDSTPINSVPQSANAIHLIRRFDFQIPNQPNWVVQVDLTKTLTNPLEFDSKLRGAKEMLVDSSIDLMSADAYDFVLTKIVQVGNGIATHDQLSDVIDSVNSNRDGGDDDDQIKYQNAIFELAKDIFRDDVIISQFKRQSGFKRICANTVEMSRSTYFKQILPDIEKYYLTDKMDGTRAMLVVDEIYRRSGHRRIYLGANVFAVSDRIYEVSRFDKPSSSKTIETDHTVLDVEMIINSNENYTFHCFDVIALASKRMSGHPFKSRLEKFDEVRDLMDKHDLGSVKTFVKLSKENFANEIDQFYALERPYHIDGLIFTPEGMYFKEAVKLRKNKFDKVFNTEYSNTISFKWKPLDQLTIDFYLMQHPTKKDSYVLCSGVDTATFNRLQLEFFDGYVAPTSPNAHKYFPIQFESYDKTFDYVWTPTDEEKAICTKSDGCDTLRGMVGEFKFAEGGEYLAKPKLTRLRTDRVQDIAKGEYFGNALRYAELVISAIQNPLTLDLLCNPKDMGYFANDDNEWYKAQRNFNSFVKTYLMETYLYPKTKGRSRLMDIACGKGQDIARAMDVGFDEIVAMDKDLDALYELVTRKFNLRLKKGDATASIHIKKIDLEDTAAETISSLKVSPASVDAAICNFALHYICHSAKINMHDPLKEFATLTANYLKSGGRLLITAFDGKEIFNRLQSSDEWALKEANRIKYSVKKQYASDTLANIDQPIGVLLPFSAGYYTEYLVNFEYIEKVFEEKGFKVITTDGFGPLLTKFQRNNNRGYRELSDIDKEWVSQYSFIVLEKL